MTTITRWDPFRDLLTLHNRLSHALADSPAYTRPDDGDYGSWVPPVDILERGDDLVIRAELPGLKREAIEVRVEENTLVLAGERRHEYEMQEDKIHRSERVFGSFTRRFALPATVDPERIRARYSDGVLEIVLPKAEEAKPRKIEIDAV
jgi:HSP20 family protein